jgi:hypothetical protein
MQDHKRRDEMPIYLIIDPTNHAVPTDNGGGQFTSRDLAEEFANEMGSGFTVVEAEIWTALQGETFDNWWA